MHCIMRYRGRMVLKKSRYGVSGGIKSREEGRSVLHGTSGISTVTTELRHLHLIDCVQHA